MSGTSLNDEWTFWLALSTLTAAIRGTIVGVTAARLGQGEPLTANPWFWVGVGLLLLAVAAGFWALVLFVAHGHGTKHAEGEEAVANPVETLARSSPRATEAPRTAASSRDLPLPRPVDISLERREFVHVPLTELTGLHQRNTQMQAQALLESIRGKWIKLEVVVADVESYGSQTVVHADANHTYVVLNFSGRCHRDELVAMRRGHTFTVEGRLALITADGVTLHDCMIPSPQ